MPLPRRDHSESNSAPVASFERESERDVREGLRTEDWGLKKERESENIRKKKKKKEKEKRKEEVELSEN